MENHMSASEQRLFSIIKYAPLGVIEIDQNGVIQNMNLKGEELLMPIISAYNLSSKNLFPIFRYVNEVLTERIQSFSEESGLIAHNETHTFLMPLPGGDATTYFNIMVNKMDASCIMVSFDDITEKHLKEEAMRLAVLDKAVEEGKYEIASGVLHDIGNAVVGFGSYLTRIRRVTETNSLDNLRQLAGFFEANLQNLSTVLGPAKSQAIIDMLNGISERQTTHHEEINKTVTEQINIVNHIQEILNIHRQYLTGRETQERRPVNLRSIISDCTSMLLASADKKAIAISISSPPDLPIIKGDRTKLMQVILNVLKNSIEAIDMNAPEKDISIRLYTHFNKLILQVQDSGSGFDEENGKLLFGRGFTTKTTGTGLGLYNCRMIIETHAGTINIISDGPGKGAITTIEFPIQTTKG
ncbi:MAG: ATP-binding protein [Flavipsychrobacter sp.]|nr:ATP-binding protein [Flavipsychrobacter sp.]